MLSELRELSQNFLIRAIEDDILNFPKHISEPAQLIVCMGDTITHLKSFEAVQSLFSDVAANLANNGIFVLTFRDYVSAELTGAKRFIPVRSDDSRILTCFLEYREQHIEVHDLLYQKELEQWSMEVSSYQKLRLDPNWICDRLRERNLTILHHESIDGMVCIVAKGD